MIERNFIKEGIRNADIEAYLKAELNHAEYSHSEIKRTPLNTRIIIYAGRPGMVIGRSGSNIQKLTDNLETKFKIDKPQLEIKEVESADLDARVTAKRIASAIERGNNSRKIANIFLKKIIDSGAIGAEIIISGKSGGGRSRSDKFHEGYLKKCGNTSEIHADRAKVIAITKPGSIGIKVRIMRELPEEIRLKVPESAEEPKAEKEMPVEEEKTAGRPETDAETAKEPSKETKEMPKTEEKEKKARGKKENKPDAKTKKEEALKKEKEITEKTEDEKESSSKEKKSEKGKEKIESAPKTENPEEKNNDIAPEEKKTAAEKNEETEKVAEKK